MKHQWCRGVFLLSVWGLCCGANAHTRWDPNGLVKPRSLSDGIKSGPCGVARGNSPVVLEAGATVEVQFEATIYHQGYFRIAFSPSGDQRFDDYVLIDNIPDINGKRYRTASITLPDMECDQCTLQLIQVMLDRSPPSNYFSCADIQLKNTTSNPTDTTPPQDVSALAVVAGDANAQVMWQNPTDEDLNGVLILLGSPASSAQPEDGQSYETGSDVGGLEVVYNGLGENFTLTGLTVGMDYDLVVFAYDEQKNYASGVSASVRLLDPMDNLSPVVQLQIEQNGQSDLTITPEEGEVIIQAQVSDPNVDDQHTYDWSGSDVRLHNLSSSTSQFRFDPSGLNAGDYHVNVTVTDTGMPPQSETAEVVLTVAAKKKSGGSGVRFLLALVLLSGVRGLRRRGFGLLAERL